MEDLESALALNFSLSAEINNPSAIHPRFNNYKNKARFAENQEERRKKALESSKARREELVNELRRITCSDENEVKTKKHKKFGDHLMLSEWFLEIPKDFEENYYMVLCCAGKRCLIVAAQGSTICYDKGGSLIAEFKSALAGGNDNTRQKSTVLDCLYDHTTKTYHVIDMICQDTHYLYQCETEFRWFWMECKFREDMHEASRISANNPYPFILAPRFSCSLASFKEVFSKEADFEVDGILIYNKQYPYVFGFSPITTWLKPYMIPEILGIEIHESYSAKIPSWYSGFSNHLEKVKRKAEEREQRRNKRDAVAPMEQEPREST